MRKAHLFNSALWAAHSFSIFHFQFSICKLSHNPERCPDTVHGGGHDASGVSGAFAARNDAAAAESEQVLAARHAHRRRGPRFRTGQQRIRCVVTANLPAKIRQAVPQHGLREVGQAGCRLSQLHADGIAGLDRTEFSGRLAVQKIPDLLARRAVRAGLRVRRVLDPALQRHAAERRGRAAQGHRAAS